MKTRGVIFDMDGVLVDSYKPHFESWRRLAASHGVEMTQEQFAATFGRTSREIIELMWGDRVQGPAQIAAWDRQKEAEYREILKSDFPEMDGADDLLERLSEAGFRLAVGSSGPPENVAVVRDCLRSGHFFETTVNGHEVKHGKPAPDIFLMAAAKLGLQPRHCLVVEDAPAGVAAARAAGMAVIAILGTAPAELLADADAVVKSLREITPERVNEYIDRNK